MSLAAKGPVSFSDSEILIDHVSQSPFSKVRPLCYVVGGRRSFVATSSLTRVDLCQI